MKVLLHGEVDIGERLRLYALASWVVLSIFFVLGLWFPEWRGLGMVL